MSELTVILGNQLFPTHHFKSLKAHPVFMAEDISLCTHEKYHKHKLMLFLASMRKYSQELSLEGFNVIYHALEEKKYRETSFLEKLYAICQKHQVSRIHMFDIEDKFFETQLEDFAKKHNIVLKFLDSPMFLINRARFKKYLATSKKPFMKTFYEVMRQEKKILLEPHGTPQGGQWSFDSDNRKKIPKALELPVSPSIEPDAIVKQVAKVVDELFPTHPGDTKMFWLPTSRAQALTWLDRFVKECLAKFGDYQDAFSQKSRTNFHSILSPSMNVGHLLPQEVIEAAVTEFDKNATIPLHSIEGFVRQILGWREFVRGIYQNYSETQTRDNFFKHERKLKSCWYSAQTGIPILDRSLRQVIDFGYSHHIERLMLFGNIMLLCEVQPQEVHRWFMEMHVDSSDWVMGPNVYGMSQFSDGGLFATKPYICASNYLLKMSDEAKGTWCEEIDALYWVFIDKHRTYFERNYRMSMMVNMLDKKTIEKRNEYKKIAQSVKDRLTSLSQ